MFLDQAEFRSRRRQVVYMADWETWLDKFLADQELPVLTHAGRINADAARTHAESQYELFHARRVVIEAEEEIAIEELESRTETAIGKKK